MDIVDLVNDRLMVVIPVLWFIAAVLKNTPYIKNWLIPWIICFLGIVLCIVIAGFDIQSVLQGILCSGIALFGTFGIKGGKKDQT